ncbi:Wzz/FepE/Etk N-terminal domain-containing protein [Colwellia psychrerythraea]|uniref:Lipopolysaccharide biosynthesis protein n=1 Tax=Colwellia psychrerythraea TaxID=28229 RepID=A0A099KUR9_COLPS|nr:Wzz/FepE/Etk N-terminal domain-containing protein [Colwellia psychrerythraea]KGJ93592.1 lipopolysaccharide biosynthesis protein [Colwellia psychrerythraea]
MSKSVESSAEQPQAIPNNVSAQLLQQQLLQQQLLIQNNQSQDEEIDLAELWRAIWAGKFTIIIISMIFAIASVFFALSKPNIYKASAILAPASSEGGAGGFGALAGQFGGLASMAGINLGGGGGDKTALALEVIKSRSFIENFITKHDLLVPLMASKNWDITSNILIVNEELYDKTNKKWIREVKAPKKAEPSSWEAYKEFSDILTVSQDKKTSMVNISVEFFSPPIAKQWLTWLIEDINEFMREQDQIEAKASIDYLTEQLVNIKVSTMETVFYQLIEEQTKNMMLTKVKNEYVLKTIDAAQVPDTKAKPKRALIVVLGTILGGILSILIVLTRYYTKK